MQVTAVFGFMIKKWQIGDQIHDHNRGELACHPEALVAGFGPPPSAELQALDEVLTLNSCKYGNYA